MIKIKKTAVIIDLKAFKKHDEEIEDLLDILISESKRDEPSIPFEDVMKTLRIKGEI